MGTKAKPQRDNHAAKRVALVDVRTGATRPGNEFTTATYAARMWESFQAAAAAASKAAGISRNEFLRQLTEFVGPSIQLIEDGLVLTGSLNVPIWTRAIREAISTWKKTGLHDELSSGSVRFSSDSTGLEIDWLTKNFESDNHQSMGKKDTRANPKTREGVIQPPSIDDLKHPDNPQLHERIAALVDSAANQVRDAIKADERKNYEIAEAAGISRITLSQFMGGSRKLAPETLDKLAALLKITLHP